MTDDNSLDLSARLAKIHKPERRRVQEINDYAPTISSHSDCCEIQEQKNHYGSYDNAKDYLSSFDAFISESLANDNVMKMVISKPEELTIDHYRNIHLMLNDKGFDVITLWHAWYELDRIDVRDDILGYIRKSALNKPLVSFDERINRAMELVESQYDWDDYQKRTLRRLGNILNDNVALHIEDLGGVSSIQEKGGTKRFNKILDNRLDELIKTLSRSLWL